MRPPQQCKYSRSQATRTVPLSLLRTSRKYPIEDSLLPNSYSLTSTSKLQVVHLTPLTPPNANSYAIALYLVACYCRASRTLLPAVMHAKCTKCTRCANICTSFHRLCDRFTSSRLLLSVQPTSATSSHFRPHPLLHGAERTLSQLGRDARHLKYLFLFL